MAENRIEAYEKLIARYLKSIADFASVEEELRTLPPSENLNEAIRLNRETRESIARALRLISSRLERERREASAIDARRLAG